MRRALLAAAALTLGLAACGVPAGDDREQQEQGEDGGEEGGEEEGEEE